MQEEGNSSNENVTAFRESESALREQYRDAEFNPVEFQRKLTRCSLATCRGMCCYGGVAVDTGTAKVLQELATERAGDFHQMGLDLPDKVVERTEWHGTPLNNTVLKPFPFRSLVDEYPKHFEETACVFLMDDSRCGLQVLAEQDGKHPWYYKPFSCWLLPIKLWDFKIRLFDETSDPFLFANYDGFISQTQCGRTSNCGLPAVEVLKPELAFLGRLLNRNLLDEISLAATTPTTDMQS